MKFKPGQQVLCLKKGRWRPINCGPQYNEICTIERFSNTGTGDLVFYEYPQITEKGGRHAYHPKWFEPLITDTQLEEELETIEQFV